MIWEAKIIPFTLFSFLVTTLIWCCERILLHEKISSPNLCSTHKRLNYIFYYMANHRDAISRNPKKYGIIINFHNDFWLKKAFNIDMPMCSTAADYSLVPSITADGKIVGSWFQLIWKLYSTPPQIPKIIDRFTVLRWLFIAFYVLPEISRHVFAQAVFTDFSYIKRNWIIGNL